MPLADVDIANMALRILGDAPITQAQFTAGTDKVSKMVQLWYEPTRQATLDLHHWNFAMKRAILTNNGVTPAFGYTYQQALPADCIRVWLVVPDQPWQVEGTTLLWAPVQRNIYYSYPPEEWFWWIPTTTIDIKYISLVTDATLYPMPFVMTFAAHLAMIMAENVTGKVQFVKQCEEIFMRRLASAQSSDDLVGTPPIDNDSPMVLYR